MYRDVDALLVRAAAYPIDLEVPAWPPFAVDTPPQVWRTWLGQVWAVPAVAEAITAASPVLAEQVRRAVTGSGHDRRQLRRMVLAVARYLLRMTGRCTPFGRFAGVAAGRIGPRPVVRWGDRHHAMVRPGTAWLSAVVTDLERCMPVLRRLPVTVNNTARVRGDQLVVPFQRPAVPCDGESLVMDDVAVRLTPPVTAAVGYASVPIVVAGLVAKLAGDFPTTPTAIIESLVGELVRLRILLTALRPPMTDADVLGHLLTRLDTMADLAEVAEMLPALTAVRDHCRTLSGPPAAGTDGRPDPVGLVPEINHGTPQASTVDLRLDVDVTLPPTVIGQAGAAAAALTQLTPYPTGMPAWREYHGAFLERYGPDAVVPLLELVAPETGLGLPATYRGSHRSAVEPPPGGRDRRLLRLIHQALAAGLDEITLDDQMLAEFAGDTPGPPPPHVEVFFQVHAPSVQAIEQGRYELVVTGASRAAGATTGRFLPLLDPTGGRLAACAYAAVPTLRSPATPVQVSCPPVLADTEHLARTPKVMTAVISVSEFPVADSIPLADLGVGADANGMFLVWLSRRQLVEPTVFNAVEFRNHSHPMTRFLSEVTRARAAVYMPFTWGIADELPFLPRLRYGRTVLAPARWHLTAGQLPGRDAPQPQWQAALAGWREQMRMPHRVSLVEADNLLPLDLTQQLPLALLRAHLSRHPLARLEEAPPADAYGWIAGHAHEIVIPLAGTVPPLAAPLPAALPPISHAEIHLPGDGAFLSSKVYAPADRHTDLLARIGHVLAGGGLRDWWYVPYRDPDPHLRLRLHLPDGAGAYGAAARHVSEWAHHARRLGLLSHLVLDTYQPETGRYGHGLAMAAAEQVFAADSRVALAHRHTTAQGALDADALAAAGLVNLAVAFTGDVAAGLGWLIEHLPHQPVHSARPVYAAAIRLADPHGDWAALYAAAGRTLVPAYRSRQYALTAYRQALTEQRDPSTVLPSLLHMHHVRTFGIDPARERLGLHLARAAALRWTTRPRSQP